MCVVFTRQKFSHVSSSELDLWQGVLLENGERPRGRLSVAPPRLWRTDAAKRVKESCLLPFSL